MKKLVLLMELFTSGLWAQGSQTIYQVVFNQVTTAGPSSPITNIGQITHLAIVSYTNAPAKSCTAFGQAQFEYSYNGSTWSPFGSPQGGSLTRATTNNSYFATGAFPYVRFNLVGFDTVNCVATVNYSGSLAAGAPYIAGSVLAGTTVLNNASTAYIANPVIIGGLGGGANASPIIACDQTAHASITTAASVLLAPGPQTAAGNYQIYVCAIEATTAGATATLQIQAANSVSTTCDTTLLPLTGTINLIAGVPFIAGSGVGTIYKLQGGGVLPSPYQLQICGSATVNTVNVNISYAFVPIGFSGQ